VKKRVTNGVHFDNMKKDNMANYSTNPFMDFKISPFMRKGKLINTMCVTCKQQQKPEKTPK